MIGFELKVRVARWELYIAAKALRSKLHEAVGTTATCEGGGPE